MRTKHFVTTLMLLFMSISAPAQTQSAERPPSRDQAALAVLSVALNTHRPELVRNVVVTTTITDNQGKGMLVTHKIADGNTFAIEHTRLDGAKVRSVKQQDASFTATDLKIVEAPLWIRVFQRHEIFPLLNVRDLLDQASYSMEYLGDETVSGRKVSHIAVWTKDFQGWNAEKVKRLSEFHLYVDAETGLLLKTKRNLFAPDNYTNYTTIETLYSEYQSTSGFPVPGKIEHFIGGQKANELRVESVQTNQTFSAADFQ